MSTIYERLSGDDMRLLTVYTCNGTLSSELHTYPRTAAPEYDAVSYAWGDDMSTSPLRCNEGSVQIRTSLFNALPSIHNFRPDPKTRPLWIDAVCLNQADDDEKAEQVLRMHEVYRQASRTLIWLGEAGENSDLAMESMQDLTHNLSVIKKEIYSRQLPEYGLPPTTDPIWEALRAFVHRPWFSRLWVLQEIVLSEQPVLMCGSKSSTWNVLNALHRAADEAGITHVVSRVDVESSWQGGSPSLKSIDILQKTLTPEKCLDLSLLIALSANRAYSVPVDRLWALLGLMHKSIRPFFLNAGLVDYGEAAISRYHETFFIIMIFQISDPGSSSMDLIEWNSGEARNPLLPSWCPDWHMGRPKLNFLPSLDHRAGRPGGRAPLVERHMQVLENGVLELCGLAVDIVDVVTTSVCRVLDYLDSPWLDECLVITDRAALTQHNEYFKMGGLPYSSVFDSDGFRGLEDLRTKAHRLRVLDFVLFPPGNRVEEWLSTLYSGDGYKFFSTKAGRFGIGPATLKENDILGVMYGASFAWALRPQSKLTYRLAQQGDELVFPDVEGQEFELLGRVYTPTLSKGQAWEGTGCESMRKFRII